MTTQPLLSQAMLIESGYERHDDAGYRNIFGISISGGRLIRLAARWDIYVRGILHFDEDAEVISILVAEEVSTIPLATLTADPFDLCRRARARMDEQPNCVGTLTAVDLGAAEGGGEAFLLASQIREQMPDVLALRTVADADLPRPIFDGPHRAWKMSPEALIGSLAARAGSRQVLIADEATTEARRILTDALRQAGTTSPRSADGLTRILAWVAEIAMRPLAPPAVTAAPEAMTTSRETYERFKRQY